MPPKTPDGPGVRPYRKLIDSMCSQYPTLQRLAAAFDFQERHKISGLGRAIILEISSGSLKTEVRSFEDPLKFAHYLDLINDTTHDGLQRLCILEDVVGDFVELIGTALVIDPSLFATHLQLVNLAGSTRGAHPCGPPMPSTCSPNQTFSIIFHELINHVPRKGVTNLLCNFHARRKIIWRPEMWNGASRAGIVGRRISFWAPPENCDTSSCRYRGWIGLLLVDPPLSRYGKRVVQTDWKEKFIVTEEPHSYMGGYVDFTPWPEKVTSLQDLSNLFQKRAKATMTEDIIAHWESGARAWGMAGDEVDVALFFPAFAKNLAAANWMTLLELVKTSIRHLEWRIDEKTKEFDENNSTPEKPEIFYSQKEQLLHTFKIQWNEYREQVFNNIAQLGLSSTTAMGSTLQASANTKSEGPTNPTKQDKERQQRLVRREKDQQDWSYILWNLEFFISQASDLSRTMAVRVANREARKSNQFGQAAQRLAGLGVVFLPLGLVAGIFSMGGTFLPGNDHFWVYVAVAFPLLLGSLTIAFLPLASWLKKVRRLWKDWKMRMHQHRKKKRVLKHQMV